MRRFNLLHENWIKVIIDDTGETKEVSLLDAFENAHLYKGLGGESKAQDFSILRVLLAVLHTVFSRFDADGDIYENIELDDMFRPQKHIDEDNLDEYIEELNDTWIELWDRGSIPPIVLEYLLKWEDYFYLYDDEHPFYQVRKEDILPSKLNKQKPTLFSGKNMNRLISESGNKISLFSPKYGADSNKEKMTDPEVARWLITLQNYIGLSDKVIFGNEKYTASKGWLFDIGGIVLRGDNFYETLIMNLVLLPKNTDLLLNIQEPCWEKGPAKIISDLMKRKNVDNLAELYTNWSRAIHMSSEHTSKDNLSVEIVKLPDIDHENPLEPMTMWKMNPTQKYGPRKHRPEQAMWRNFGMLTFKVYNDENTQPGIIQWLSSISNYLNHKKIHVEAISMRDDGNATSWMPIDEIYDSLNVYDVLLVDDDQDGWVYRVNDAVEFTKKAVEFAFKGFIADVRDIRNISSKSTFVTQRVEELYTLLDQPFKRWISGILPEDEKDSKVKAWKDEMRIIVVNEAEKVIGSANNRDFKGLVSGKNIATAYNDFMRKLNSVLKGA